MEAKNTIEDSLDSTEQEIVFTEEEQKQIEKGIQYSRVVAAIACVLADLTRLTTRAELYERFKQQYEEFEEDWERMKKSLKDQRRLIEMWKKHPIID